MLILPTFIADEGLEYSPGIIPSFSYLCSI